MFRLLTAALLVITFVAPTTAQIPQDLRDELRRDFEGLTELLEVELEIALIKKDVAEVGQALKDYELHLAVLDEKHNLLVGSRSPMDRKVLGQVLKEFREMPKTLEWIRARARSNDERLKRTRERLQNLHLKPAASDGA